MDNKKRNNNKQSFNSDSRSKIVKKNIFVAFFSVLIPTILVFISRKVFLETLNLEYLGLSETFSSLLSSLTLTELGFQAAIVYNLYKPIQDNDIEKVNKLISILRFIFNCIGCVFILVPFLALPFIGYILKGVEIDNSIRLYFLLIAFTSAITYFLGYSRCLIQADQKNYVNKAVDLSVQIIFVLLQIIILIYTGNFILYLMLNIFRNVLSNLIIQKYCKKSYPFLHKVPIDRELTKGIWNNAKNIFSGRIAGVLYNSVDNILISTFIGTVAVGSFSNYSTIATMIKTACYRLFPVDSIIGNMLADDNVTNEHSELIFRIYTMIKSIMANLILIPLLLVFNPFIHVWLGEQYIFSQVVVFLIVFDLYAYFLTNSTGDYIFAKGLFEMDKKISIIGLSINAISSLIMIQFLGVIGVLIGTALSQLFFWSGRCYILYKYAFKKGAWLRRYIYTQLMYLSFFVITYMILAQLIKTNRIELNNYSDIAIVCFVACVIIALLTLLCYNRLEEYKYLIKKIKLQF